MPSHLCPCGSGLRRASCDPARFAICRSCGEPYHFTSPNAQRCPGCRVIRNREMDTAKHRRLREARRRERYRAAIAHKRASGQLELEEAS